MLTLLSVEKRALIQYKYTGDYKKLLSIADMIYVMRYILGQGTSGCNHFPTRLPSSIKRFFVTLVLLLLADKPNTAPHFIGHHQSIAVVHLCDPASIKFTTFRTTRQRFTRKAIKRL